jgi:hypothetical protein
MSGSPAVDTYFWPSNFTGVRVPFCPPAAEFADENSAKVGCGSTLSQSPPSTVHVQPVVCALWAGFVIHFEPSTSGIAACGGYGVRVIAAVGHTTDVPQLQPI